MHTRLAVLILLVGSLGAVAETVTPPGGSGASAPGTGYDFVDRHRPSRNQSAAEASPGHAGRRIEGRVQASAAGTMTSLEPGDRRRMPQPGPVPRMVEGPTVEDGVLYSQAVQLLGTIHSPECHIALWSGPQI
jgi:hypothetical protein